MTIDHVTIRVSDYERSRASYVAVLDAVGLRRDHEDSELQIDEWGDFSIAADGRPVTSSVHVAFAARDRGEVEALHRVVFAAGGVDNGVPGERPVYHPGYFGAFLLDPDGNNVEAVFHDRTGAS